jgi:hypothetical protein
LLQATSAALAALSCAQESGEVGPNQQFWRIFHIKSLSSAGTSSSGLCEWSMRNSTWDARFPEWLETDCTKSGHLLVDWLHSPASTADRASSFLLTLEMKRVKRQSFFDTF